MVLLLGRVASPLLQWLFGVDLEYLVELEVVELCPGLLDIPRLHVVGLGAWLLQLTAEGASFSCGLARNQQ